MVNWGILKMDWIVDNIREWLLMFRGNNEIMVDKEMYVKVIREELLKCR